MCGIVGCHITGVRAFKQVVRGLEMLEYRGYDSWGIAGITNNTSLWMDKQVGNIRERKRRLLPDADLAIGHTRWATHGGVSQRNAHPHTDNEQRFAVVHNGVIENWEMLKLSLPKTHTFISETDTEIIPHLLSALPENISFLNRLQTVSNTLIGNNAFVVIDTTTKQLGAACFGSPLLIGKGATGVWVVSDVSALPAEASFYMPLATGMVAISSDMSWHIVDSTGSVSPVWLAAPAQFKRFPVSRRGQMMKAELSETPQVVKQSALIDLIPLDNHPLWLTGAGTAYHAALWGALMLRKEGRRAIAFPASESESWLPVILPSDSVLAISQSGETRDTLTALETCRDHHISTIALINREHSSMSRIADQVILSAAGLEQAVLATKSLTSQLVIMKRLADMISLSTTDWSDISKKLRALLGVLPTICRHITPLFESGAWTAVIGRGMGLPLAMEMALKLKEGTYIPADGLAGGELKHGSLALVQPRTLCVVMDVDAISRIHLMQNAAEVKARGGTIIGISPLPNPVYDEWIPLPDLGEMTILSGLLASQYLTYQVALVRGINPDRPRNLAKSVTVE